MKTAHNFCDMSGTKVERLTVIRRAENGKNGKARWECLCDCGNVVIVSGDKLRNGYTKSCGCMSHEALVKWSTKHGKRHSRLYGIWCGIKRRTTVEKCSQYDRYGGRGIVMFEDWYSDFEAFYEWSMSNGYRDDLSIDRIDNDGGYFPDNCRWTTRAVQANNTSRNRYITIDGVTHTLIEWCRIIGIDRTTVYKRLKRGMSEVDALTKPLHRGRVQSEPQGSFLLGE